MPKILVYGYEGCEPVECLGTIDVLRRAEFDVTLLGQTETIKMAHGVNVIPDKVGKADDLYDCFVITGGKGWANAQKDAYARELTEKHIKAGKVVCAICAAPAVCLAHWGLIDGKAATCFPGKEDMMTKCKFSEDRVVVDGNLITARGAGVSLEFGLAIVEKLGGNAKKL